MIVRKFWIERTVAIAIILLCSATACASGLKTEYREKMFSDLDAYEPLPSSKKAAEQIANEKNYCQEVEGNYPTTKACLEQLYMVQGYYKVSLAFKRVESIPASPKIRFIDGSRPLKVDRTERDAYIKKWSDKVLTEYLGTNYHRFSYAKFGGATKRTVSIEIHVRESSELEFLIQDSRVRNIEMITSPRQPLEEIAN